MYLGDTTNDGNTIGFASDGEGGLRDDNGIGMEFTLSNIFKVYNNLDLYVIGGLLLAGDAYGQFNIAKDKNVNVDDPWVHRHETGLQLLIFCSHPSPFRGGWDFFFICLHLNISSQ